MRLSSLILASLTAGVLLGGINAASAQDYSNRTVAECSQTVGQLKFEGWAADRNREMMTLACEQNGGTIPGAAQAESPAALRSGTTHHTR